MREDYPLKGAKAPLQAEVEKDVIEKLQKMEGHTKIPLNQMVNTALKRFIATHSDFLPPGHSPIDPIR
jgi:hypothetical protein